MTEEPATRRRTLQAVKSTASAGDHIGQFCKLMHSQQGELAVRRMQGLLSFAKKYGIAGVDDACAAALEMEAIELPSRSTRLERR